MNILHQTLRNFILITLLLLAPCAPVSAANDFSGAWVAWLCPGDVPRESGKCSNFVLELHQKDGRVCGAHLFATAGATRVDEGAAPSIMGDVAEDTATIVAVSGRAVPPIRVRAEMKMVNGALQWQRLESPAGDYLLPKSTRLIRLKSKTLFAPVFEHELKAACSSAFTMAAENARQKSQRDQAAESADKP